MLDHDEGKKRGPDLKDAKREAERACLGGLLGESQS